MLRKESYLIFNEAYLVVNECNTMFREGWEVVPKSMILKKGRESKMFLVVLLERYLETDDDTGVCDNCS